MCLQIALQTGTGSFMLTLLPAGTRPSSQTPFYDAMRVVPDMPLGGYIPKRAVPTIRSPAEALLT